MSSRSSFVITTALLSLLLIGFVSAQVGPDIKTPEYNATVTPGDHITIEYEYSNVGTGNYTVDLALWQDASATQLIQNVTTDHAVDGGNSTGVQLNFTYTASYDWTVPGGLTVKRTFDNGTEVEESPQLIYLTVTAVSETSFFDDLRLRSRPVLLHYNAATLNAPNVMLLLGVAALSMMYLVTGL
ncbi:hypothetical protein O0I10_000577 [Lichtheimia ornata]|uniref:Signal sequence receptor subunit alpha n=1 Tax=Lichtheimia ornata TaxID=688661 RepID=A0AAD7Y3X3_9FUNG|nr:uncharacterized protein O0I10_000577 [Lichtheimia ornata]KAJ8663338.1 hypothetical protein O0I10_000577 [Lichtheimia ornata]